MASTSVLLLNIVLVFLAHHISCSMAQGIGVCYGLNGDNLPSPKDVIDLYKRNQVQSIRLFEPVPEVLEALRGSGLSVSLGMRNEAITSIAANSQEANTWVNTHVAPYRSDVSFAFLTVGNEVVPGPMAQDVAKAMYNIWNALLLIGLDGVKVTTVVPGYALGVSYPPSAGSFSDEVLGAMTDIASFLYRTSSPLMINVYPYFAYASNPEKISLDYALFNSEEATLVDEGLKYYNLFDAMVDSFYAALEKVNFGKVSIVISESGWPSAGKEPYTSIDNARTYSANLMKHVQQGGTPRRPDQRLDTFFFAMFNENLKPAGEEQNFGLFYPNMEPIYSIW